MRYIPQKRSRWSNFTNRRDGEIFFRGFYIQGSFIDAKLTDPDPVDNKYKDRWFTVFEGAKGGAVAAPNPPLTANDGSDIEKEVEENFSMRNKLTELEKKYIV